MGKLIACNSCKIAYDGERKKCPICGKGLPEENKVVKPSKEGEGRKYYTGGDACDICPWCYGTRDYCPIMGN